MAAVQGLLAPSAPRPQLPERFTFPRGFGPFCKPAPTEIARAFLLHSEEQYARLLELVSNEDCFFQRMGELTREAAR
jgi:hypothetical protein